MLKGIDHIVVVVPELEAAIAGYTELGFTVVRGGKHNIGTHNALIAFADGSYIELIAFLAPVPGHPWYAALAKKGGLVDFCAQTDDLGADVAAMRAAGVSIGDPAAMTRERPDGYRLSWVLSIPNPPFNGSVPFLIKDETPRDERVPRARTHRNGVSGIRRLIVAVRDSAAVASWYKSLLARDGRAIDRPELEAHGTNFTIGAHELEIVSPRSDKSPLAEFVAARGAGPYQAILAGPAGKTLDSALTQGARLAIG